MAISKPATLEPDAHKPRLPSALITDVSLLTALILGSATPSLAADKDDPKHTVTRELAQPLTQARADVEKRKYTEAIAKLKGADANPKKTPWDQHIINELFLYAYASTNNYVDAAKTMEATIKDGFTDPAETKERIKQLATIYYRLNDYGKALLYAQRAVQGTFADSATYVIASESHYQKGDFQNALRFTNNYIEQQIKKGDKPTETQINIVLSSCIKLDDRPCTTQALERMVSYYPKPEYWQNLISALYQSNQTRNNDADLLGVYRLADEVGAIRRSQDYTEMAQLALVQGSPGEARQVLEKAFTKCLFTDERTRNLNRRLLEKAKAESVSDQASLTKLQHDASVAVSGDKEVALGVAYFSYQQYDKAIQALQQGLEKGGLKNPAQTQLLLGIAELKSGNRDTALQTFQGVKGNDAVLERLASLWSVHARQ
jgi:tetratricopeptide (TPR) repeat protein